MDMLVYVCVLACLTCITNGTYIPLRLSPSPTPSFTPSPFRQISQLYKGPFQGTLPPIPLIMPRPGIPMYGFPVLPLQSPWTSPPPLFTPIVPMSSHRSAGTRRRARPVGPVRTTAKGGFDYQRGSFAVASNSGSSLPPKYDRVQVQVAAPLLPTPKFSFNSQIHIPSTHVKGSLDMPVGYILNPVDVGINSRTVALVDGIPANMQVEGVASSHGITQSTRPPDVMNSGPSYQYQDIRGNTQSNIGSQRRTPANAREPGSLTLALQTDNRLGSSYQKQHMADHGLEQGLLVQSNVQSQRATSSTRPVQTSSRPQHNSENYGRSGTKVFLQGSKQHNINQPKVMQGVVYSMASQVGQTHTEPSLISSEPNLYESTQNVVFDFTPKKVSGPLYEKQTHQPTHKIYSQQELGTGTGYQYASGIADPVLKPAAATAVNTEAQTKSSYRVNALQDVNINGRVEAFDAQPAGAVGKNVIKTSAKDMQDINILGTSKDVPPVQGATSIDMKNTMQDRTASENHVDVSVSREQNMGPVVEQSNVPTLEPGRTSHTSTRLDNQHLGHTSIPNPTTSPGDMSTSAGQHSTSNQGSSSSGQYTTRDLSASGGQHSTSNQAASTSGQYTTGDLSTSGGQQSTSNQAASTSGQYTTGDLSASGGQHYTSNQAASTSGQYTTGDLSASGGQQSTSNQAASTSGQYTTGDLSTSGGQKSTYNQAASTSGQYTTGDLSTSGGQQSTSNQAASTSGQYTNGDLSASGGQHSTSNQVDSTSGQYTTGDLSTSGGQQSTSNQAASTSGQYTTGDLSASGGQHYTSNQAASTSGQYTTGDLSASGGQQSTSNQVDSTSGQYTTGYLSTSGGQKSTYNQAASTSGQYTTGDLSTSGGQQSTSNQAASTRGQYTTGDLSASGRQHSTSNQAASTSGQYTNGDLSASGGQHSTSNQVDSTSGQYTTGDLSASGRQHSTSNQAASTSGQYTTGDLSASGGQHSTSNQAASTSGQYTTGDLSASGGQQSTSNQAASTSGQYTTGDLSASGGQQSTSNQAASTSGQYTTGYLSTSGGQKSTSNQVASTRGQYTTGDLSTSGGEHSTSNQAASTSEQYTTGDLSASGGQQSTSTQVASTRGQYTTGDLSTSGGQQTTSAQVASTSGQYTTGDLSTSAGQQTTSAQVASTSGQYTTGDLSTSAGQQTTSTQVASTSGLYTTGDLLTSGGQQSTSNQVGSISEQYTTGDLSASDGQQYTSNQGAPISGEYRTENLSISGEQQSKSTQTAPTSSQYTTAEFSTSGGQQSTSNQDVSTSGQYTTGALSVSGGQQSTSNQAASTSGQYTTGDLSVSGGQQSTSNQAASTSGQYTTGDLSVSGGQHSTSNHAASINGQYTNGGLSTSGGQQSTFNQADSTSEQYTTGDLSVSGGQQSIFSKATSSNGQYGPVDVPAPVGHQPASNQGLASTSDQYGTVNLPTSSGQQLAPAQDVSTSEQYNIVDIRKSGGQQSTSNHAGSASGQYGAVDMSSSAEQQLSQVVTSTRGEYRTVDVPSSLGQQLTRDETLHQGVTSSNSHYGTKDMTTTLETQDLHDLTRTATNSGISTYRPVQQDTANRLNKIKEEIVEQPVGHSTETSSMLVGLPQFIKDQANPNEYVGVSPVAAGAADQLPTADMQYSKNVDWQGLMPIVAGVYGVNSVSGETQDAFHNNVVSDIAGHGNDSPNGPSGMQAFSTHPNQGLVSQVGQSVIQDMASNGNQYLDLSGSHGLSVTSDQYAHVEPTRPNTASGDSTYTVPLVFPAQDSGLTISNHLEKEAVTGQGAAGTRNILEGDSAGTSLEKEFMSLLLQSRSQDAQSTNTNYDSLTGQGNVNATQLPQRNNVLKNTNTFRASKESSKMTNTRSGFSINKPNANTRSNRQNPHLPVLNEVEKLPILPSSTRAHGASVQTTFEINPITKTAPDTNHKPSSVYSAQKADTSVGNGPIDIRIAPAQRTKTNDILPEGMSNKVAADKNASATERARMAVRSDMSVSIRETSPIQSWTRTPMKSFNVFQPIENGAGQQQTSDQMYDPSLPSVISESTVPAFATRHQEFISFPQGKSSQIMSAPTLSSLSTTQTTPRNTNSGLPQVVSDSKSFVSTLTSSISNPNNSEIQKPQNDTATHTYTTSRVSLPYSKQSTINSNSKTLAATLHSVSQANTINIHLYHDTLEPTPHDVPKFIKSSAHSSSRDVVTRGSVLHSEQLLDGKQSVFAGSTVIREGVHASSNIQVSQSENNTQVPLGHAVKTSSVKSAKEIPNPKCPTVICIDKHISSRKMKEYLIANPSPKAIGSLQLDVPPSSRKNANINVVSEPPNPAPDSTNSTTWSSALKTHPTSASTQAGTASTNSKSLDIPPHSAHAAINSATAGLQTYAGPPGIPTHSDLTNNRSLYHTYGISDAPDSSSHNIFHNDSQSELIHDTNYSQPLEDTTGNTSNQVLLEHPPSQTNQTLKTLNCAKEICVDKTINQSKLYTYLTSNASLKAIGNMQIDARPYFPIHNKKGSITNEISTFNESELTSSVNPENNSNTLHRTNSLESKAGAPYISTTHMTANAGSASAHAVGDSLNSPPNASYPTDVDREQWNKDSPSFQSYPPARPGQDNTHANIVSTKTLTLTNPSINTGTNSTLSRTDSSTSGEDSSLSSTSIKVTETLRTTDNSTHSNSRSSNVSTHVLHQSVSSSHIPTYPLGTSKNIATASIPSNTAFSQTHPTYPPTNARTATTRSNTVLFDIPTRSFDRYTASTSAHSNTVSSNVHKSSTNPPTYTGATNTRSSNITSHLSYHSRHRGTISVNVITDSHSTTLPTNTENGIERSQTHTADPSIKALSAITYSNTASSNIPKHPTFPPTDNNFADGHLSTAPIDKPTHLLQTTETASKHSRTGSTKISTNPTAPSTNTETALPLIAGSNIPPYPIHPSTNTDYRDLNTGTNVPTISTNPSTNTATSSTREADSPSVPKNTITSGTQSSLSSTSTSTPSSTILEHSTHALMNSENTRTESRIGFANILDDSTYASTKTETAGTPQNSGSITTFNSVSANLHSTTKLFNFLAHNAYPATNIKRVSNKPGHPTPNSNPSSPEINEQNSNIPFITETFASTNAPSLATQHSAVTSSITQTTGMQDKTVASVKESLSHIQVTSNTSNRILSGLASSFHSSMAYHAEPRATPDPRNVKSLDSDVGALYGVTHLTYGEKHLRRSEQLPNTICSQETCIDKTVSDAKVQAYVDSNVSPTAIGKPQSAETATSYGETHSHVDTAFTQTLPPAGNNVPQTSGLNKSNTFPEGKDNTMTMQDIQNHRGFQNAKESQQIQDTNKSDTAGSVVNPLDGERHASVSTQSVNSRINGTNRQTLLTHDILPRVTQHLDGHTLPTKSNSETISKSALTSNGSNVIPPSSTTHIHSQIVGNNGRVNRVKDNTSTQKVIDIPPSSSICHNPDCTDKQKMNATLNSNMANKHTSTSTGKIHSELETSLHTTHHSVHTFQEQTSLKGNAFTPTESNTYTPNPVEVQSAPSSRNTMNNPIAPHDLADSMVTFPRLPNNAASHTRNMITINKPLNTNGDVIRQDIKRSGEPKVELEPSITGASQAETSVLHGEPQTKHQSSVRREFKEFADSSGSKCNKTETCIDMHISHSLLSAYLARKLPPTPIGQISRETIASRTEYEGSSDTLRAHHMYILSTRDSGYNSVNPVPQQSSETSKELNEREIEVKPILSNNRRTHASGLNSITPFKTNANESANQRRIPANGASSRKAFSHVAEVGTAGPELPHGAGSADMGTLSENGNSSSNQGFTSHNTWNEKQSLSGIIKGMGGRQKQNWRFNGGGEKSRQGGAHRGTDREFSASTDAFSPASFPSHPSITPPTPSREGNTPTLPGLFDYTAVNGQGGGYAGTTDYGPITNEVMQFLSTQGFSNLDAYLQNELQALDSPVPYTSPSGSSSSQGSTSGTGTTTVAMKTMTRSPSNQLPPGTVALSGSEPYGQLSAVTVDVLDPPLAQSGLSIQQDPLAYGTSTGAVNDIKTPNVATKHLDNPNNMVYDVAMGVQGQNIKHPLKNQDGTLRRGHSRKAVISETIADPLVNLVHITASHLSPDEAGSISMYSGHTKPQLSLQGHSHQRQTMTLAGIRMLPQGTRDHQAETQTNNKAGQVEATTTKSEESTTGASDFNRGLDSASLNGQPDSTASHQKITEAPEFYEPVPRYLDSDQGDSGDGQEMSQNMVNTEPMKFNFGVSKDRQMSPNDGQQILANSERSSDYAEYVPPTSPASR